MIRLTSERYKEVSTSTMRWLYEMTKDDLADNMIGHCHAAVVWQGKGNVERYLTTLKSFLVPAGGSKLLFLVEKLSTFRDLFTYLCYGFKVTLDFIRIGTDNFLVSLEKVSALCQDLTFQIDYSHIEEALRLQDSEVLSLLREENEKRKKLYSGDKITISSDALESGVLSFLNVITGGRVFSFTFKTSMNLYKISTYDIPQQALESAPPTKAKKKSKQRTSGNRPVKPCRYTLLLHPDLTQPRAIFDKPQDYWDLIQSPNTSRLFVVWQIDRKKHLDAKRDVLRDLEFLYRQLSPSDVVFEDNCKWLQQKMVNDFEKSKNWEKSVSHKIDESLFDSSPKTTTRASDSSAPKSSPPIIQPSDSSVPSTNDLLESSSSITETPLEKKHEISVAQSSQAPDVYHPNMHLISKIPYSKVEATKFAIYRKSDVLDSLASDDNFILDIPELNDLRVSKVNMEKHKSIMEVPFEGTLTTWLRNNVERWSSEHEDWNLEECRVRNQMDNVGGWNASRPTDSCRVIIQGILKSVVEYHDKFDCCHGDLNHTDNYLISFKHVLVHGITTLVVEVQLVHRIMRTDGRQKDMITDFVDLLDMLIEILSIQTRNDLPRIWRDLFDAINAFTCEKSVKNMEKDPVNRKMKLAIITDHPSLWGWRQRVAYYDFFWRTIIEARRVAWGEVYENSLYKRFTEALLKVNTQRWYDRIPMGTPYRNVFDNCPTPFGDSALDELRYMRVLHLHIFERDQALKYKYFSSDSNVMLDDLVTSENYKAEFIEIVSCELFSPFLTNLHAAFAEVTRQQPM